MELYCLQMLSVLLAITQRNIQCEVQDENIIRYIEKRILGLEDRLLKCEHNVQLFLHEFQELSHKLVSSLEKFSKYKVEVKGEMENMWERLERAEWDIDYLETASSSKAQVVQ
ncbi:hypothetical protein AB205_0018370 [Aquarana catesbeiana]|uniref:IF rod domain-containing protein n=1 Tax=Aquarana catesbeiana TaxID=8400 RepID=A0A2G9SE01_AQUCT|nr:hypothetical protein AB205_0018370 [Aquarana catesbeiana]